MVAVLVVSTAVPGRTSKDPKATLVIDIVQLIAATAGLAMQQTVRAVARTRIRSFRIPPTLGFAGRTPVWTKSAGAIVEDSGCNRHVAILEKAVIGTPQAR